MDEDDFPDFFEGQTLRATLAEVEFQATVVSAFRKRFGDKDWRYVVEERNGALHILKFADLAYDSYDSEAEPAARPRCTNARSSMELSNVAWFPPRK